MSICSSDLLLELPIAIGYILTMGNMQQSSDVILRLTLLTSSLLYRAYETGVKAQYAGSLSSACHK